MGRDRLLVGIRLDPVGPAAFAAVRSDTGQHPPPVPPGAPVAVLTPVAAVAAEAGTRVVPAAPSTRANAPGLPERERAAGASILRFAPVAVPLFFLLLNLPGLPYYLLPIAERVRHPLHPWFKPSGHVGQAAGVVAFVLFAFLYLYPLRKRLRSLAFLGSLPRWLDVHIVAGLTVPVIGAMHAGWRFHGLIGLGYAAMLAVSLSGIAGRYLYMHIPRSRSGVEMSLDEIERQRRALSERIARALRTDPETVDADLREAFPHPAARGPMGAVFALVAGDLARRRALARLGRDWRRTGKLDRAAAREASRLARRQLALTQQRRMLDATHRLFRLWHVVHRPFSVTAFVAVAIHVAVAVAMGVTWFR